MRQMNPAHNLLFPQYPLYVVLSTHLRLGLPSSLFPSGFPTQILYVFLISPMRAAYLVHLVLLDLIT